MDLENAFSSHFGPDLSPTVTFILDAFAGPVGSVIIGLFICVGIVAFIFMRRGRKGIPLAVGLTGIIGGIFFGWLQFKTYNYFHIEQYDIAPEYRYNLGRLANCWGPQPRSECGRGE